MKNIVLIATMLAGAAPAFADDTPNPWGTPEDTDHCTKALTKGSKEYVNIWLTLGHNVNGKYVDKDKFFEGEGATDECKAEVGKRAAMPERPGDAAEAQAVQRGQQVHPDVEAGGATERLHLPKGEGRGAGWQTERDDFGTVIGRNIQAAVIEQQKGDDLWEVYNELWFEEHVGGHYKSSVSERGAGSLRTPIACAKTK